MTDRRFFRCDECRRRKGKCKPWPRRWNDAVKERCDHCRSRGLPCSPNVSAAGELETYHGSHRPLFNSHPRASQNRVWGITPSISPSTARGPSPQLSPTQMSPPAGRSGMQMFRAGPQPPTPPSHRRPPSSSSNGPSYSQVVQRQHQQPIAEAALCDVDALVEIHAWLRYLEKSLQLYRKAGRRHLCTSLDDKENAIANFLCRLQDIFQDRADYAMATIMNISVPVRSDLLRRLQDSLERFLGDLPSRDQGQNVPPRLAQLCLAVADRLIPEYILHGNHIQAYRTRRLSSTTHSRLRPPDGDRVVDVSEIEPFMAYYNQVFGKLTEILQFHLHPSYATCFSNSQQNSSCLSAGHFALLSRDRSLAHALYASGRWDHNEFDFLRRGAIHWAAELGDIRLLQMIHNKDPGAIRMARPDVYNLSPLCLAALYGHLEVSKFLIEQGADIAVRDRDGKHALFFAASGGHYPLVDYQLSCGSYRAEDPRRLCSPLHVAAAGGHEKVVSCLIDAGADPRLISDGYTAATIAARCKHLKLERKLRQAEREWDARQINRPLHDQIRIAPTRPPGSGNGSTASSQETHIQGPRPPQGQIAQPPQADYTIDPTDLAGTSSPLNNDAAFNNYDSFEETVVDYSDGSFIRSQDGEYHEMYDAN